MIRNTLNISISPIKCYLHHAHQLCIVLTDDKKLSWFYSNYAQVYSRDKEIDLKFDFLSYDGMYPRFPCINQNWFNREFFLKSQNSLVQFIIDCIDQGFYCEIVVDEYYIPNKANYMKKSYPHQNLIYGYDKESHNFKIVGFNKHNQFTRMEIDFERLEEGFAKSPWAGVGFFDVTTSIDYTNADLEINFPLLKIYLSDFVNSRNSFVHFRPQDAVFGLDTYQLYKKEFLEKEDSDIRPLHTFWEHKRQMVSRIGFFKETNALSCPNDLLQRFIALEQEFLGLRAMMIKYEIVENHMIFDKISTKLDILAEEEYKLLNQFILLL
ncbi:hypothetical protein D3C76_67890 [compost metagenome]